MRKQLATSILVALLCGCLCYGGQTGNKKSSGTDPSIGNWAGTWTGDGSGKFDMTIAKGEDDQLTGKINVMPDDGDGYTTAFRSISGEAGKKTIKYDAPGDDQFEVVLEANFEGSSAKGAWAIRQKGQDAQLQGGTWTATKK